MIIILNFIFFILQAYTSPSRITGPSSSNVTNIYDFTEETESVMKKQYCGVFYREYLQSSNGDVLNSKTNKRFIGSSTQDHILTKESTDLSTNQRSKGNSQSCTDLHNP